MPNASNLLYRRFSRLVVIKRLENDKHGHTVWECLCDCGNIIKAMGGSLTTGHTKSCRCLQKEKQVINNKNRRGKRGEAGFRMLKYSYKKNAEDRNLEFLLSDDELRNIFKQNCFYCGDQPSQISKYREGKKGKWENSTGEGVEYSKYIYNGIDRLDNLKGYDILNCVSCCGPCNFMKGSLSREEFLSKIEKIYKYERTLHN